MKIKNDFSNESTQAKVHKNFFYIMYFLGHPVHFMLYFLYWVGKKILMELVIASKFFKIPSKKVKYGYGYVVLSTHYIYSKVSKIECV